jgi:hypothetical protein
MTVWKPSKAAKHTHGHCFLSSELDDVYRQLVLFRMHKHSNIMCDNWAIFREPFAQE